MQKHIKEMNIAEFNGNTSEMHDFTYTLGQIVGKQEHDELVEITDGMDYEEAKEKYGIPDSEITEEDLAAVGETEYAPSFQASYKHIRTTIFKDVDGTCEVLEDFAEIVIGGHNIVVNFSE